MSGSKGGKSHHFIWSHFFQTHLETRKNVIGRQKQWQLIILDIPDLYPDQCRKKNHKLSTRLRLFMINKIYFFFTFNYRSDWDKTRGVPKLETREIECCRWIGLMTIYHGQKNHKSYFTDKLNRLFVVILQRKDTDIHV